jgi:hypothetical protein
MNRRIIIKTVFICSGSFCILLAILIYFFYNPNTQSKQELVDVLIARNDIKIGQKISENLYNIKKIPLEYATPMMLTTKEITENMWCVKDILFNEYILKDCIDKNITNLKKDLRITVIPVDMDGRLANLIKKGSLIDIRIRQDGISEKSRLVLSGLNILDVLDESGNPSNVLAASRKAYIKLMLEREQLDALYSAQNKGKIIFELYVSPFQIKNVKASPDQK